jgi:hypothetical protein
MAEIHFLPHFAEVLEQVVATAMRQGHIDVACRTDVDPAVVSNQLRVYAASTGRPLRCRPFDDRVEVRPAVLRGTHRRAAV